MRLPECAGIDTQSILMNFDRHSLNDLSESKLMDRIDSKFLVSVSLLPYIFEQCQKDYSLLDIGDVIQFQYQNVYFDTDKYAFYHMHHNGKLNRIKIRHRHYVDTGTAYLEIKFKNNKKRTVKQRIQVDLDAYGVIKKESGFLSQDGMVDPLNLLATQFSRYKRVSLANESIGDRVTFDCDLHFEDLNTGNMVVLDDVCIIELKQKKMNRLSPFYRLMRHLKFRPHSFSKYCMGMYLANEVSNNTYIKYNQFKKSLIKLEKIRQRPIGFSI